MHARLRARMRRRVEGIYARPLTVTCIEIIDISITQRTTCDSITANADAAYAITVIRSMHRWRWWNEPCDWTNHIENLKQHSLSNGRIQFTNIQGSGGSG